MLFSINEWLIKYKKEHYTPRSTVLVVYVVMLIDDYSTSATLV